jgi:hypothetical protein
VKSAVPVPIGVGILIAGGVDDSVAGNYIYDNWRRGTMLIAVPDVVSCAPNPGEGAPPCTPQGLASTSNGNRYHDNVMGRTPGGQAMPNGVDFWWDQFPSNTGNCWFKNQGVNGRTDGITADPPPPPVEGTSIPGFLPEDCGSPTNVGTGNPQKEAVLVGCVGDFAFSTYDSTVCDWFAPPPKPGTQSQSQTQAQQTPGLPDVGTLLSNQNPLNRFCTLIGAENGGTLSCSPFQHRIS